MEKAYVLTGTLEDRQLLKLDEPLPVAAGRVRVTVQPLTKTSRKSVGEVLDSIWAGQKARGFIPPTKKEVDQRIAEERNSWD